MIVWQCKSTHFFSIGSVFVFFPQIFAGFCTLIHLHRGLHPYAHVRTYIVVEVYHIGDTLLRLPIVGEEFLVVDPLDLEDAVHALGDGVVRGLVALGHADADVMLDEGVHIAVAGIDFP